MRKGIVFVFVLVLVFSLCAPCFADPVTALTGAEFFFSGWSTYAAAHGLNQFVSTNDVASDSSNPFSQSALQSMADDLFGEYQSYSQGSYQDADAFQSVMQQELSYTVGTNNQVILNMSDTLTGWYDQFANWLLGVKYQLDYDDTPNASGFVHSSGSFDNPVVSADNGLYLPISTNTKIAIKNNYTYVTANPYSDGTYVVSYLSSSSSGFSFLYYSINSGRVVHATTRQNNGTSSSNVYTNTKAGSIYYGVVDLNYSGIPIVPSIPLYSSLDAAITACSGGYSEEKIKLRPQDKYNEKPIPIPDTSSEDYVPDAISIPLSEPYDPTWDYAVDPALQSVLDQVRVNEDVISEAIPDPDPPAEYENVVIPFLPPTLPSFDLSLSGIWHYVIDWVASLGSGFSAISAAWSALPSVMILPIYASLVVVVVVGMYRRFFM